MMLLGNINAIPFRRRFGGGGGTPFPSIPGMIARWSAKGLTNEDMSTNPVWKDLTGNGHDLQMKNFGWAGMSGVNGYVENFNQWFIGVDESNKTVSDSSMKLVLLESDSQKVIYDRTSHQIGYTYNFYIKVTGIEGRTLNVNAGTLGGTIMSITEDGIYSINATISDNWGNNMLYLIFPPSSSSNTVTIEQLPLYPDAIVFDGVDDYGVCENFPILTKEKGYTVVALRQYLEGSSVVHGLISNAKNWFANGAFVVEYYSKNNNYLNNPVSFGAIGSTLPSPNIFTYQTSTKYNGTQIKTGNYEATDLLIVGGARLNGYNANAAIWEICILDHDATEEELQKIQDYYKQEYPWLFPDQAWTVVGKTNEDTDRATIANIMGNGNNLVLSNFGFAEDSGYNEEGEYAGYLVTDGVDDKIESKQPFQLPIKFSMIGSWVFIKKEDKRAGISKENNLIVYDKITGLTLFLNSVESYEEIDIDSFHAISSDGKLYDENWNMLPITVGSLLSDSSTLKIAYDGNNFVQFAFNCMGFYDKILKKDDLLKGWIYLKGLKAQRIPPSKNYILKEDGGYVLQEDGNKILTEQQ